MNLETLLDQRLWRAIDNSYTNRNFTGAILDAIHFLSNLLREKTGLQSDGVALVGASFGGKSPKLKVNKLETESEINVQKGIEQILRGIYQAIRNPRSHEKHKDDKMDAEAIVIFINYLINIIDKSKSPFTLDSYLESVFDPDFVEKDRYAELLVKKIPEKKRFEVFVEVFRNMEDSNTNKLRYFFHALCKKLNKEQIKEAIGLISDGLKCTTENNFITSIIKCFPSDWWKKYDEVARLRVENKLIQSIKDGRYDKSKAKCFGGGFGTWAGRIIPYFTLKYDLLNILHSKLQSSDRMEQDYAFQYIFPHLVEIEENPSKWTRNIIQKGLKQGDIRYYDGLFWIIKRDDYQSWKDAFQASFDSFVEVKPPINILEDDIPF